MCQFHTTHDTIFDEATILRAVSSEIQPLLPNGY